MIIDLTHPINEKMSLYPGTPRPLFRVSSLWERDGFKETAMQITSHMGTHLDTPHHVFKDGPGTDILDMEIFAGSGVVIDCSNLDGIVIDDNFLRNSARLLSQKDFIFFCTGWDKYWGSPQYLERYPAFSREAIDMLAEMKIKGIGVDFISVDPPEATYLYNHKRFLQSYDRVIIENLCGLKRLIGKNFAFYGFPLKIEGGDGSPIRAVAVTEG